MGYVVGFDVFTQVEFAVGGGPDWLQNGAAAWASWRALGYPASSIADIGPFNISLDCNTTFNKQILRTCSQKRLREPRRVAVAVLRVPVGDVRADVHDECLLRGVAERTRRKGVESRNRVRGVRRKAADRRLDGDGTRRGDDSGRRDEDPDGSSTGAIPSATFGINHLATTFVEIDRGDGDGSHQCYAATLTLNVQIPAGVTSSRPSTGPAVAPSPFRSRSRATPPRRPFRGIPACGRAAAISRSRTRASWTERARRLGHAQRRLHHACDLGAPAGPGNAVRPGDLRVLVLGAPGISLFGPKVTTLTGKATRPSTSSSRRTARGR